MLHGEVKLQLKSSTKVNISLSSSSTRSSQVMKPGWVPFNSTVQWSHLQMELDLKLNLFHSIAEIRKKNREEIFVTNSF